MTDVHRDHVFHFLVCAIATLFSYYLMSLLFPFAPCIASCWFLPAGLGIGKEYGDHCATGNRWDWSDILADFLGIIAAIALILLLRFISVCIG